jgi:hypothetical protein
MHFQNVYWDWDLMQQDGHYPSILAIGDSWFWYPFPGGSLLNHLGPMVATKEHYILAFGNNGAEAYDCVYGKYSKSIRTALTLHGSALSAVWISGGGNDFAGFNDLRPLLKADCSSAKKARGCFRPGDSERTLNWLMRKTGENYTALIGQIFASCRAETMIFLHNYDYAVPSGKGVFGKNSAWLKPALDDAKVPENLQHECMKYLIDRFTSTLEALSAWRTGRLVLVNSRGVLAETDWANELHPKPSGFKKIAKECWLPALRGKDLAS